MPGTSVLIFVAGVTLSVAAMLVIRRIVPAERLSKNNDYVSLTFAILGPLYGIYLAFTVVVVWQQYEDAEATVTTEVAHLIAVWRDVEVFPDADRARLQRDLIEYTKHVIVVEYPGMERGLAAAPTESFDRIWRDFSAIVPDAADTRETAFYGEALSRLNELSVARRQRILASNASLPWSMWILLILGATGTIAFTWFYSARSLWLQIAVTAFVTAIIIDCVLIVGMLEYPFGSGLRVSAAPFQDLLRVFEAAAAARR